MPASGWHPHSGFLDERLNNGVGILTIVLSAAEGAPARVDRVGKPANGLAGTVHATGGSLLAIQNRRRDIFGTRQVHLRHPARGIEKGLGCVFLTFRLTRQHLRIAWLALAGLLIACSDVPDIGANEVGPSRTTRYGAGLFELEGDAVDGVELGLDAASVWAYAVEGAEPADIAAGVEIAGAVFATDVESFAGDTLFVGAGSRDPNDIADWAWTFGPGIPAGQDLLHGGAAFVTDGDTDKTFLYLFADRREAAEEGAIGVWLLKRRVGNIGLGISGASDPFNGSHATGDILIVSDFGGDGSLAGLEIYQWLAPANRATDAGVPDANSEARQANPALDLLFAGGDCAETEGGAVGCATVNSGDNSNTAPWRVGSQYGGGQFFEGGIDLTHPDLGLEIACFSSVLFASRDGREPAAPLRDFVVADLALCDADIRVAGVNSGEIGAEHSFAVTVTPHAPSGVAVEQVAIVGSLDPAAESSSTCATPVGGSGVYRCSLTFTGSDTGPVIANARTRVTFSDGTVVTRDTDPATVVIGSGPGGSGPATTTLVAARVDLDTGGSAEVGAAHEVRASLLIDSGDGAGFVPAPDGSQIDLRIVEGPGALSAESCLTEGGSCGVGIGSDAAGIARVAASAIALARDIEVAVASGVAPSPDAAVLAWVDAAIEIAREGDDTADSHSFTVTVREDPGTGFVAAAGETVEVSFATSDGEIAHDPVRCTTNLDGRCTVVIASSEAGRFVATATANVSVGGISLSRSTDGAVTPSEARNSEPAVVSRLGAFITIEADGSGEVGRERRFTVTVMANDGGGFAPLAEGHVAVALSDANGAAAVVDSEASSCDDAGDNLSEEGSCELVFTSASAGMVTGSAAIAFELDGVEFALETNGSGDNSGPAETLFFDAALTHSGGAAGVVGSERRPEFSFWLDDGTGRDSDGEMGSFDRVAGAQVIVNLADANGAAHTALTQLSGVSDEAGRFAVAFTSPSAGLVVASASAGYSHRGVLISRASGAAGSPAGAREIFVDAFVVLEQEPLGGIGEEIAARAILWRHDGSEAGFVPAADSRVVVTFGSGEGASAVPVGPLEGTSGSDGAFPFAFRSDTPGTVGVHAAATIPVGGITLFRETDGSAPNGPAGETRFVAGSLRFEVVDDSAAPLCCAMFGVERSADRSGGAVDGPVVVLLDNSAADADDTPGIVSLPDLMLGDYTVRELAPPPGYRSTEAGERTVRLTLDAPDTAVAEPFVFRLPGGGCAPEFWQGDAGARLWDSPGDGHFSPAGGNPFGHEMLFNDLFMDRTELNGLTMLDLLRGPDGEPVRAAARALVAGTLNSSHDGVAYAFDTTELKRMWIAAVIGSGGDKAPFVELQRLLDGNNRLGCDIE